MKKIEELKLRIKTLSNIQRAEKHLRKPSNYSTDSTLSYNQFNDWVERSTYYTFSQKAQILVALRKIELRNLYAALAILRGVDKEKVLTPFMMYRDISVINSLVNRYSDEEAIHLS